MEIFSILWKVIDNINIYSSLVFSRKEIALKFPKSYSIIRFKGQHKFRLLFTAYVMMEEMS